MRVFLRFKNVCKAIEFSQRKIIAWRESKLKKFEEGFAVQCFSVKARKFIGSDVLLIGLVGEFWPLHDPEAWHEEKSTCRPSIHHRRHLLCPDSWSMRSKTPNEDVKPGTMKFRELAEEHPIKTKEKNKPRHLVSIISICYISAFQFELAEKWTVRKMIWLSFILKLYFILK